MLEKLSKEFTYKKLTEEEQKSRGILGRLVGVIADSKEATRNGRRYSEQLWENVFSNPIMQEKITNRCVLGELGHPTDRTEIDIEKVAICLAETPKLGKDGKLYGVFDILSTPNGKILKALCDYGCKIGVSSRGQGDLETDFDGNESVVPESYECECWDAVLVPAVFSARPTYVTESLDSKALKLKKALSESYNNASDEDKKIMKETLNSLNIDINEAKKDDTAEEEVVDVTELDLPVEGVDAEEEDESAKAEEESTDDVEPETVEPEATEEAPVEDISETPAEDTEKESEVEKIVIDTFNAWKDKYNEEHDEKFPELEDDTIIEFMQVLIDAIPEEAQEESPVEDAAEEPVTDNTEEGKEEEAPAEEDAAEDTGADELVDSLKEALEAKSTLEENTKELQAKLAVSDTKVEELEEKCDQYEKAIQRLSAIAKKGKDLEEEVASLKESLQAEQQTVAGQKQRIERLVKAKNTATKNSAVITESVSAKSKELNALNEELKSQKTLLENTIKEYEEKLKNVTEGLEKDKSEAIKVQNTLVENFNKEKKLKEGYKSFANKAANKYIEVKAMMLGLSSKDIKRKLGESYTLEDVDQVCESLKDYQLNVNRLPFGINDKVSFKVNEARPAAKVARSQAVEEDDSISESLMKLANL